MAIDSLRKRVNLLGFGWGGVLPWPDGTIGSGDQYTLLGLSLTGNDRWRVPMTHDSTYQSGYAGYALVYDHASGTWVPVRVPWTFAEGRPNLSTASLTIETLLTLTVPAALLAFGIRVRVTSFWDSSGNAATTHAKVGTYANAEMILDSTANDTRGHMDVVTVLRDGNKAEMVGRSVANTSGFQGYVNSSLSANPGSDLAVVFSGYTTDVTRTLTLLSYRVEITP